MDGGLKCVCDLSSLDDLPSLENPTSLDNVLVPGLDGLPNFWSIFGQLNTR